MLSNQALRGFCSPPAGSQTPKLPSKDIRENIDSGACLCHERSRSAVRLMNAGSLNTPVDPTRHLLLEVGTLSPLCNTRRN